MSDRTPREPAAAARRPLVQRSGSPERSVLLAAALDVAAVLVFVLVGRRSHGGGAPLAGALDTAWPFLGALALGWVVARAWQEPTSLRRGAGVAAVVVAGGLLLRVASGGGAPLGFAVVTTVVLGALLLGWRAIAVAVHGVWLSPS